MDNGCLTGVIFLDFKNAFDCVDHNNLIKKLTLYGNRGNILNWFRSYLTDQVQTCKIGPALFDKRYPRNLTWDHYSS